MVLRANGLPVGAESFARWRGRGGTLKEEPVSESGPEEVALETGVGLRIVNETLESIDNDGVESKEHSIIT